VTVSARVDAVVIGAGHNGLVAANLLADEGWSVLVLERAESAGGAVRSAEVTAPGFVSDLCSSFYPLGSGSPVLGRLGLESHGLRWRHAPAVLAHVFPDDECAVLDRDVDATAVSLDRFSPGDGETWRRLQREWLGVRGPLLDALFRPFPPVVPALRLAGRLGIADGLRFARLGVQPVRRYAEEMFRGEGARALIAGNAMHTDLPPDGAGSAVFGWLLAMLGQEVGFPVPEGGASRLMDALLARLRARGGRLELRTEVSEILVREGRAHGVRTSQGDLVLARHAVLADVAAPALFLRLVGEGHLPQRMLTDLDRFQWDNATLKIDWALGAPIPWLASEATRAGTVHLGADVDGMTTFTSALTRGRVPDHPFVLCGQMTTADPTRSPKGTEAAWAYTHVPQGTLEHPDDVRRHAERVEALFERHAPGFGDLILGRHLQGPRWFSDENPNTHNGSVNGGTASLHQQLVFRPIPGLGRADTPIDRLFLAGASAHPGGGVHGGPGSNAARAAVARRRYGGLYAAMMREANRAIYAPAAT
jgi:phytoene dehydrogenase-like protein